MPQCQNMKLSDIPYGKGSLHNALIDSTFRTRRRAAQINKGETARLKLTEKMMNKNQRADSERSDRVINGVKQRMEELQAYKHVLKSYSADNLQTLQWGFKPRNVNTPRSFQRYKLETKIYHCGFTIGTFYPEIKRSIEAGKPQKKKESYHKRLFEMAKKRSDFMIDRRVTNDAMWRERQIADSVDQGIQPVLFLTNEDTILEEL